MEPPSRSGAANTGKQNGSAVERFAGCGEAEKAKSPPDEGGLRQSESEFQMSTVTLSLMSSDEAKTTRTHKDGIAGKYRAAREKAVKHMRFVPLLHGGAYSVTSKSHAENPVLSPYIVTIYSCSCSYEGLCSHIIAVRDLEIPGHADRFPDTAKTEKAEPRRVCRGVQPTSKPSAFAVGQYPQGEAVPVRNVCRTDAAAKAADFD